MQFYNTHPGASSLIFGADLALEEDYQTEVGDNLKVALMGPLAGVGDTIQGVLVTPTLKDSYDTAYNNHNRALATLKQRHMEAINAIAETKKQNSII